MIQVVGLYMHVRHGKKGPAPKADRSMRTGWLLNAMVLSEFLMTVVFFFQLLMLSF